MSAPRRARLLQPLISSLLLLGLATAARAQVFCVYDPLGTQGDFYNMARDYQLAAKRWGLAPANSTNSPAASTPPAS